jgi:hypothetical protein
MQSAQGHMGEYKLLRLCHDNFTSLLLVLTCYHSSYSKALSPGPSGYQTLHNDKVCYDDIALWLWCFLIYFSATPSHQIQQAHLQSLSEIWGMCPHCLWERHQILSLLPLHNPQSYHIVFIQSKDDCEATLCSQTFHNDKMCYNNFASWFTFQPHHHAKSNKLILTFVCHNVCQVLQ